MSMTASPYGLRVQNSFSSGAFTGPTLQLSIAGTTAANGGGYDRDLFEGDPVIMTGSGGNVTGGIIRLDDYARGGAYNGTPSLTAGPVRGIFLGTNYRNASGQLVTTNRWTSGTQTFYDSYSSCNISPMATVFVNPDAIFKIQATGNTFTAANQSLQAQQFFKSNLFGLVVGTGNAATGISTWALNAAIPTTNGLLRVIDKDEQSRWTDQYPDLLCTFAVGLQK